MSSNAKNSGKSKIYPLEHLAKAIVQKRAMVFVGAGVSVNSGLPNWETLVKSLADKAKKNFVGAIPTEKNTSTISSKKATTLLRQI